MAPAAAIAILLTTALIYWPSTQSLLIEWFDAPASSYTHGPLVVGIVSWLLLRALRGTVPAPLRGRELFAGALASSLLSFAWLIAWRAGIQVAHQALLPLIILVTVTLLLGLGALRRALVPLAILYSAIPVWHVFVPVLQILTVKAVGVMLHLVNVPAYVEGDFVYIRSGVFHVEDGCSGLHYFIVAATIALLSGELREDRWRTRVALLAVAVALSLLGNWVRVFIIILAGYLTDMQHVLVRADHGKFGWVVFAVAMLAFVFLVRRWSPPPPQPSTVRAQRTTSWHRWATSAVVALLATGVIPLTTWPSPVAAAARPNVGVPVDLEAWSGPTESCATSWLPQYASADWQRRVEYRHDGRALCLFLATYLSQHQGKELIGYLQAVHEPGADVVAERVRDVAGVTVNEIQLGSRAEVDRLVWYAYAIGGKSVRRGIEAQLAYALGTLRGPRAASVYAIGMDCAPDCAAARESLTEFLPHVVETIRAGGAP